MTTHPPVARTAHFLRLVCRCRHLCRYLCRFRLRLYVQRVSWLLAARFCRLTRVGLAGVLARRISLFRVGSGQRAPCGQMGRAPSCGRWNDRDRLRPGACKLGSHAHGGLRRVRSRGRNWHRAVVCSGPRCDAALVRQAPRLRLRYRCRRYWCRHACHAAGCVTFDHQHLVGARPISSSACLPPLLAAAWHF